MFPVVIVSRNGEPMYEYACHEGNYDMTGILSAARASNGTRQRRGSR